ncbi:hypothetical protein M1116_03445 [Patescibacteria group bacterium]|nr:hypothetical protein [Patescibacteria group bacterium]
MSLEIHVENRKGTLSDLTIDAKDDGYYPQDRLREILPILGQRFMGITHEMVNEEWVLNPLTVRFNVLGTNMDTEGVVFTHTDEWGITELQLYRGCGVTVEDTELLCRIKRK